MPILDVIGFLFDELLGIFEWSRRSLKKKLHTLAAWAVVLALIFAGFLLAGSYAR